MAEQIVNGYKRLFEVRLLHHYWLDQGSTIFDALPKDEAERAALMLPPNVPKPPTREERLLTYDIRPYLKAAPTAATETLLKGLGCVFKQTGLGFVVAAPAGAVIPSASVFEFPLTMEHAVFPNVSTLTMRPQKIYEIPHQDKIYRFKEGVFVFSNVSGSKGTINTDGPQFFLSKPTPALPISPPTPSYQAESLIDDAGSVKITTADNASPNPPVSFQIGTAAQLPVYVHHEDIPPVVPPLGLTGAPPFGITLNEQIPDEVFAMVRIVAADTGDPDFNITDGSQHPKSAVFQLRFLNRLTIRKYYRKSTKVFISQEANPLPLTFFGNAGTKQKPPPEAVSAALNPAKEITELFSEIFE